MSALLIILSLVALSFGIFGWLWLCSGLRRGGWRGGLGIAAVQVSGLFLAYGIVRGQPLAGVFMAVFPPAGAAMVVPLGEFGALAALLARTAAPWALGILGVALVLRPLRIWAPGLALFGAMVSAILLGDSAVEAAMCRALASQGGDSLQRQSLADSLAQGQDVEGHPHGFASVGQAGLIWSYQRMDWVDVPKEKGMTPPPQSVDCKDLLQS